MSTTVATIGKRAKKASRAFALASTQQKNAVLRDIAAAIGKNTQRILRANRKDVQWQGENHPLSDRLRLSQKRLTEIRESLRAVTRIKDPVGEVVEKSKRPNGLHVSRVRTPIGVLAVIYESRPNVTVEITSLCLKTGNAVILKGGKEAANTNAVLVPLIQQALAKNGFPKAVVQILDPSQRALVKKLLKLNEYVDMIVPRGGAGLIRFVRDNATVPVIETGAGVCHTYVERTAPVKKAAKIVVNAKTQRPTVCNALDTLLIDRPAVQAFFKEAAPQLSHGGVTIKADPASYRILQKLYPRELLKKVKKADYGKEFLGPTMAVKTVSAPEQAFSFIEQYTSGHSEAILTENKRLGDEFLSRIDAAAVFMNTSTRFTDGFQFGLGAEVGISTQKLHARGPMGLRDLTTIKWIVRSDWKSRN